jgi:hypothetical protein
MVPCPGCNQPIETQAIFCPHCGEQSCASRPPASDSKLITGYSWMDDLIGFLLYWLLLWLCFGINLYLPRFSTGPIITPVLLSLIAPVVTGRVYRYRSLAFGLMVGFVVAILLVILFGFIATQVYSNEA